MFYDQKIKSKVQFEVLHVEEMEGSNETEGNWMGSLITLLETKQKRIHDNWHNLNIGEDRWGWKDKCFWQGKLGKGNNHGRGEQNSKRH